VLSKGLSMRPGYIEKHHLNSDPSKNLTSVAGWRRRTFSVSSTGYITTMLSKSDFAVATLK
jgi:hypothetical protein